MNIGWTATVQKIKFVYAQFRGTVTVKVALDHFLQIRKEVKYICIWKAKNFFCSRAMCQPCTGFLSEDWSCVGPGMNLKIKQKRNLFIDFSLFLGSKDWPWQLQLHFVTYGTAYLSTDFLRSVSPCQEHI